MIEGLITELLLRVFCQSEDIRNTNIGHSIEVLNQLLQITTINRSQLVRHIRNGMQTWGDYGGVWAMIYAYATYQCGDF